MEPLDTFNSFDWIHICLLDMSSWVVQNLMYVVESEFLLPRYINPVQTHYVVSELENVVKLIEHIDTSDRLRYKLCLLAHGSVSCYIFVWLVSVKQTYWLIVEEHSLKMNCIFLVVTWYSIISLEQCSASFCWPIVWISFLVLQTLPFYSW